MKIVLKIFLVAVSLAFSHASSSAEPRIHLVCSTYPIRLLTREVVADVPSVRVDLLVPAESGCPHDYVLTPADMRRLMRADAVILNGLGLDDFIDQPLASVQSNARRIDTSDGIDDLLPVRVPAASRGHGHRHADEAAHAHHEPRQEVNPHVFASPRYAARIVENIAAGLAEMDPEYAASYAAAAREAADRLRRLAREMAVTAKEFERRSIVTQHDALDYLARDLAVDVVAVIQGGHAQEPTATALRKWIRMLREHDVAALIAEPQYRDNVMRILSAETGVPLATLDPVASGPADAGLDYYEAVMRSNIETLQRLLR